MLCSLFVFIGLISRKENVFFIKWMISSHGFIQVDTMGRGNRPMSLEDTVRIDGTHQQMKFLGTQLSYTKD